MTYLFIEAREGGSELRIRSRRDIGSAGHVSIKGGEACTPCKNVEATHNESADPG